jgi:hypothetical protein
VLLSANAEAWQLWLAVNTQWRIGPNGVVGLDYQAVIAVSQVLAIPMTKAILSKIRSLEDFQLKRLAVI